MQPKKTHWLPHLVWYWQLIILFFHYLSLIMFLSFWINEFSSHTRMAMQFQNFYNYYFLKALKYCICWCTPFGTNPILVYHCWKFNNCHSIPGAISAPLPPGFSLPTGWQVTQLQTFTLESFSRTTFCTNSHWLNSLGNRFWDFHVGFLLGGTLEANTWERSGRQDQPEFVLWCKGSRNLEPTVPDGVKHYHQSGNFYRVSAPPDFWAGLHD